MNFIKRSDVLISIINEAYVLGDVVVLRSMISIFESYFEEHASDPYKTLFYEFKKLAAELEALEENRGAGSALNLADPRLKKIINSKYSSITNDMINNSKLHANYS